MKPPTVGEIAWLTILGYEFRCPPGQMLCQILDPFITRHPILSRALILYTALHMANMLDERVDVYYQLAVRFGR